MKRKSPVEIGYRMVEELYRLYPSRSDKWLARHLGCSPTMILAWKNGVTPSPIYLVALHYMGGDVMWILIGDDINGKRTLDCTESCSKNSTL